ANPILTAHDVNTIWTKPEHQVITVHNAGVTTFDGKTVMLFRSHLRAGISVIGLAKSQNGLTGWIIEPEPALKPATVTDIFGPGVDPNEIIQMESGGVEDPRIHLVDGEYFITYS